MRSPDDQRNAAARVAALLFRPAVPLRLLLVFNYFLLVAVVVLLGKVESNEQTAPGKGSGPGPVLENPPVGMRRTRKTGSENESAPRVLHRIKAVALRGNSSLRQ